MKKSKFIAFVACFFGLTLSAAAGTFYVSATSGAVRCVVRRAPPRAPIARLGGHRKVCNLDLSDIYVPFCRAF